MAVFKCKMCGGDLEIREGLSVAECEYCGSRQTIPSADNEKKLTLFARAGRLLRGCEFDKAAGIFESIVADFPEEAEAYWGLVLCKYGIEYVDDPATGKKIPTCHRSSFESVMDDKDLDLALENADAAARKVYRDEAKQIEELRRGIVAVSANEEPYDIFICYKETDENGERTLDSVLAQDIYDALMGKGYRTFFARISLEDKLGLEYEPYIFAALHSAKVMLAIGTDYEYFNAVWVKNEWSRFLKLMTQDKSKHLIPCYKGIDAYDMPKEFARLQAQDLGKVGAVQDLLRGIDKLIGKAPAATVVTERVVVGGSGDNKIASLLDRGNMALEDGDWAKADSFFEDVLNNDSKNAQAYLGKTLVQERCRTIDAFIRKRKDASANAHSEKKELTPANEHITTVVKKYVIPSYLEEKALRTGYDFDLSYLTAVPARQAQLEAERCFWAEHKLLSRAEKFAAGAVAENLKREKEALFAVLADRVKKAEADEAAAISELKVRYAAHLAKADKMAEALHNDAVNLRENYYQSLCGLLEQEETPRQLWELKHKFEALNGYKDSSAIAKRCEEKAQVRDAELAAEAERQRIIAAKKAKEKARKTKRILIFFAVVAVLGIAAYMVYSVFVSANAYKEAEALLAEEKTEPAAAAFGKAGNYKDAAARSLALWDEIVQRETVSCGYTHTAGLKSDGTVIAAGDNDDGQCDVGGWTDIVAISAGDYHTVGLKSDGSVVAAGDNDDGQCDVSGWTDIVAISEGGNRAAGGNRTVGLKSDGTVVAVGDNDVGRCDVGSWTDIVAISAGVYHTVGLKSDGSVVAVGDNVGGQCDVGSWTDIVAISAGDYHTVGLKSDGSVVAVGYNGHGQCELDGWTNINPPTISAEQEQMMAVARERLAQEQAAIREQQEREQAAIREQQEREQAAFEKVLTNTVAERLAQATTISAGWGHTVGLKDNGTVVAVGMNGDNWLRDDNWTKIPEIFPGSGNALNSKGDDRCNVSGWASMIAISAGYNHTVGLKSNGTVVATGGNEDGQCNVDEWTNIVAISAGKSHTVGLKADGTVVAAGWNGHGQCDVGNWTDIVAISTGVLHTVGLKADGTVVATGLNISSQCNVDEWTNIVAINAGWQHTIGLKSNGTVVAIGGNENGQCDVDEWTGIVAINAGWQHTTGLKLDGTVVAVGANENGQCDVETWDDIVAISAGEGHTVGLKSDGTMVATGSNLYGQCNVRNWADIKLLA